MFKVGDKVKVSCLIGEYEIIALLGNQRDFAVLSNIESGMTYHTQLHLGALRHVENKPKNTFTIEEGQIEAAARFIIANNSYLHDRSVTYMIDSIKCTIKDMVDNINKGQDDWYTGSAGYVVTVMQEDDNYYVVDVLVDPTVSQDNEFINVEEII